MPTAVRMHVQPQRRVTVQADFRAEEVEILRIVLEGRMDTILMEIANTDSRDYKAGLVGEADLLEGILAKLGCVHKERSLEASCSNEP